MPFEYGRCTSQLSNIHIRRNTPTGSVMLTSNVATVD